MIIPQFPAGSGSLVHALPFPKVATPLQVLHMPLGLFPLPPLIPSSGTPPQSLLRSSIVDRRAGQDERGSRLEVPLNFRNCSLCSCYSLPEQLNLLLADRQAVPWPCQSNRQVRQGHLAILASVPPQLITCILINFNLGEWTFPRPTPPPTHRPHREKRRQAGEGLLSKWSEMMVRGILDSSGLLPHHRHFPDIVLPRLKPPSLPVLTHTISCISHLDMRNFPHFPRDSSLFLNMGSRVIRLQACAPLDPFYILPLSLPLLPEVKAWIAPIQATFPTLAFWEP